MPRELFSSSVSGVSSAARRGRLVPVSILFHAVLLGGILALQLFANTAVPEPQRPLNYRIPIAQAPPPAAPIRRATPSQGTTRSDAAPLVTPDKMPSIDLPGQDATIMEGDVEVEGARRFTRWTRGRRHSSRYAASAAHAGTAATCGRRHQSPHQDPRRTVLSIQPSPKARMWTVG